MALKIQPIMPYTTIRPIAFRIPTAAAGSGDTGIVHKIPPGIITEGLVTLSGTADDLQTVSSNADLHTRLQRLLKALKQAQTQVNELAGGTSTHELKVFVAPEFYFRSAAATDYTQAEFEATQKVLQATLAADESLAHWMLIAGTFWYRHQESAGQAGDRTYYFNAAILTYPGFESPGTVQKVLTSNVDGLPGFQDVNSTTNDYRAYAALHPDLRQTRIFTVGGIRISLDICLEHAAAFRPSRNRVMKLNQTQQRANPGTASASAADLAVLVAAGKPLVDFSTSARTGGYRFRNDGYSMRNRNRVNGQCCGFEKIGQYYKADLSRRLPINGSYDASQERSVYTYGAMSADHTHIAVARNITFAADDEMHLAKPANVTDAAWAAQFQGIKIYPAKSLLATGS